MSLLLQIFIFKETQLANYTISGIGHSVYNLVVKDFQTPKGAKTIVINRKTHHIFLPSADYEAAKNSEKPKVLPGTFVFLDIEPMK